MANKGITEYDVHRAADILFANTGASPTNLDVLQHLGTGSATTINKHMQTWRNSNSETMSSRRHKAAITKGLAALVDELDVTVKKEYANQLESMRARIQAHESSLEELSNTTARLQDEIDLKEAEIEELNNQNKTFAIEHDQAKVEITKLSDKKKELYILLSERDAAIHEYIERSKEHKLERKELVDKVQSYSNEAATLREINKGLSDKYDLVTQELSVAHEKLQETTTKLLLLGAEHDATSTAHSKTKSDLENKINALSSEAENLRNQLSPLKSNISELKTEKAVINEKFQSAIDKLAGVEEQLRESKKSARRDSELILSLQKQIVNLTSAPSPKSKK